MFHQNTTKPRMIRNQKIGKTEENREAKRNVTSHKRAAIQSPPFFRKLKTDAWEQLEKRF